MKYLSVPRLQKLSAMMQAVDVGDRIVHARVEAYSCKLAGEDKRAAKEITLAVDSQLSAHLSHGVSPLSPSIIASPLGDLHEASTKQLLVSLITTLNASNPDYDFSGLRPEDFERENSTQAVINSINNLFLVALESALGVTGFRSELWSALEETVFLHECEIYKYEPPSDSDESAGKLWALHMFFFHRKLKKLVLLSAEAVSKLHLTSHAAYQHAAARTRHHHHSHQAGTAQTGAGAGGASSMEGADESADFDDDDDGSDGASSDDGHAAHNRELTAQEQAEEDDAMEAAEDEMLEEMDGERSAQGQKASGEIAGSYVDASLLEWEQPLEHSTPALQPLDGGSNLAAPYDSSPSSSSTSSTLSMRHLQPLPDSAVSASTSSPLVHQPQAHSPHVRLASTRSPTMRPAVGRSAANPIVLGGPSSFALAASAAGSSSVVGLSGPHSALPPRGSASSGPAASQGVSLFGGSHSSFSSVGSSSPRQYAASGNSLPAVPAFAP